jgi:hypothetical protein
MLDDFVSIGLLLHISWHCAGRSRLSFVFELLISVRSIFCRQCFQHEGTAAPVEEDEEKFGVVMMIEVLCAMPPATLNLASRGQSVRPLQTKAVLGPAIVQSFWGF